MINMVMMSEIIIEVFMLWLCWLGLGTVRS